jgi:protein phosphatase
MHDIHEAKTALHHRVNPSDKHFGPKPPPVSVRFGAATHPGRVRINNEDHFVVFERQRTRSILLTNLPKGLLQSEDDVGYVMAVADGVGGMEFGELASMLAIKSGWDLGPTTIKWTWIITDREVEELRERMELIFRRMDTALLDRARADPMCTGMGTTLTGVYTVGPEAFIGHVGDSRIYLYHKGKLVQMTRDHTLAQQCLELGVPVQAQSWHHILTNCLGGGTKDLQVDFHHFRLGDGDRLLLCSDGLTDMVAPDDIARIVGEHGDPQQGAQALVDLALDRGGRDNVTVVLAHYAMEQSEAASHSA